MKIYLVAMEPAERDYFHQALAGEDVTFVATLDEVAADAEVLSIFINEPLGAEFLRTHPRLRMVQTRSGGTDHLDVAACQAAGIPITYLPGYGDIAVAEHTFALLLALVRRLREVMAQPERGRTLSYAAMRGFELHGKMLGIIGLGRAGRRVAALAEGFGMRVLAYDPLGRSPQAPPDAWTWCTLEELLAQAHIVTLHVRLSPLTHHLLNRETLAQCRPGVLIINTARGRLIDTQALQSGQVGGAGLDVLEQEEVLRQQPSQVLGARIVQHLRAQGSAHVEAPAQRLQQTLEIMRSGALLQWPHVVFTPHVAFNTHEAVAALREGAVAGLRAFFAGELRHPVEPAL